MECIKGSRVAWLGKLIDIMRQASSITMNTPKNDAKSVVNLRNLVARPINSYWGSEWIKCFCSRLRQLWPSPLLPFKMLTTAATLVCHAYLCYRPMLQQHESFGARINPSHQCPRSWHRIAWTPTQVPTSKHLYACPLSKLCARSCQLLFQTIAPRASCEIPFVSKGIP